MHVVVELGVLSLCQFNSLVNPALLPPAETDRKQVILPLLLPRRVLPAKRGEGGEKRWIESLEERGTKRSFIYLLFLAQRLVFSA